MLARPALLSTSYRNAMLNTLGLVSYWRLGDSAGTVAIDETGRNNGTYGTGPVLGTRGLLAGDPNTAVTFAAGATNHCRATQVVLPTQITLMAWVNASAWTGNSAILGQWVTNGSMLFVLDSSNLRFYVNGNALTVTVPSTGASHFIVGTYDGAQGRIYIDSALVTGPTNMTGPLATPAVTFDIATYNNGGGAKFTGIIDEAAYFDRVLSQAQIDRFYRIGRGF